MKAPTHLNHKPIVSLDDYDKIDGVNAGKSDAKALSVGKAQWNKRELSLKVWRKKKRWSPQSEELPIHRNLDLSILFIKTLRKGYHQQSFLVTQEQTLSLHEENGSVQDILDYYEKNKQYLEPRMKELKRILDEWL